MMRLLPTITDNIVMIISILFWIARKIVSGLSYIGNFTSKPKFSTKVAMSPDDKCTTKSGVHKPYHCRIMKQKKKKNYISTPLTMLCLDLVAKNSNAIGKNMEISVKSSSVLDHYQRSTFLSLIQIQPDTSASKFQSVGFRQAGKVEIVKVIRVINHAQVSIPNFIMKLNIISLIVIIKTKAYEYNKDEIPFFSYGDLYTSEISSGIHFEFNLSHWIHDHQTILQQANDFQDSENCIERKLANTVPECFPATNIETAVKYDGDLIEELSLDTHNLCFEACMKHPQCSFVHIRPEEPWTRDPISMRCSLLKSYKWKVSAGSYVSANKTCLPKNETLVTCVRNFKIDPSNPIHRLFQRKRQHAESTLRRFFKTVLDLDPHRLTKSPSDRQHQSPGPKISHPSDQSYDDPPAGSHVTSNRQSFIDLSIPFSQSFDVPVPNSTRPRTKRRINWNVNFDMAEIATSVFSGLENLFSLPTLKQVIRTQKATIHKVQLLSERTKVLLGRSIAVSQRISELEKNNQIINLVDILDEVIDEIKNMEHAIKSIYKGILSEHLVAHDIANEALEQIEYQLSTIGLSSVQTRSLDLYCNTKSDSFLINGTITIFSHIDAYDRKNPMKLFELANLPLSYNGSLFNLEVQDYFLARSEELREKEATFLILDKLDFSQLKKINKNEFLLKNPEHRSRAGDDCLINLFLRSDLRTCQLHSIPEPEIVYATYLADQNLVLFCPNQQLVGLRCKGKILDKHLICGYSVESPANMCQTIIAQHIFESRFIDFNISMEARNIKSGALAHLFDQELEAVPQHEDEQLNATFLNETQQNIIDLFNDADEDLQNEIDANAKTSKENKFALAAIGTVVGFFTVLVIYIQCKEKITCSLCCCPKQELP